MVIQMCYAGPRERGVEYLQAISSWDGERCLLNEVNEKSFLNQQDSVAQVLRGKGESKIFGLHTALTSNSISLTHSRTAVVPPLCLDHDPA